ncbi:MAG: tRNA(His) guanylyltransferase Thg1 family protein [Spirochaetota bacterium]
MKFSELDEKMRIFETNSDIVVLPGIYMVARIDGRNFTTLTKSNSAFEAPFDTRFRDLMVETTKHLMDCGFKVEYGYTQSDEISLLFDPNIDVFSRKTRKYNSILAGEASAIFSVMLGKPVSFDCRICQLPAKNNVVDYFRWRNEDASRNALNAHCYWMLRKEGMGKKEADSLVSGKSVSEKNELLFARNINFNNLPNWQKRGTGLYWTEIQKTGFNPMKGQEVETTRTAIKVDYDLPMKDEYSGFIENFLNTKNVRRQKKK